MHLLHVFSTFAVGGPQIRFADLANRLGGAYRHSIVALDGRMDARERLAAGLDVRFVEARLAKSGGIEVANLRSCRRLIAGVRPDRLLTYNWGAIEWALANRWRPLAPHLHFEDGFGPEESIDRQLPRRVLFRRVALSGAATRIVVPSRTLHRLATERWRFSPARVLYIPNGIDGDRFATPDPAMAAFLCPEPARLVVGTLGVLRPEKNLSRLLRVFARLPPSPVHLAIVGGGPERERLEAAAVRAGLSGRVTFTGPLPEPGRILGHFDLFAMTSDTEQMPLSLLEAMASGLPVVATDVGDIKEMVAVPNRPYIVPPDDEDALLTRIIELLGDPVLRRRLGDANREKLAAAFTLERMIETYDRLFHDPSAFRGGEEGWARSEAAPT